MPSNMALGFPVDITVQPVDEIMYYGRVWLITDSENFSGPNFAYIQMAQDAGFSIVYEQTEGSIGWATSFTHLENSGIVIRLNPLYFTDDTGLSFEAEGAFYNYRIYQREWLDMIGVTLP